MLTDNSETSPPPRKRGKLNQERWGEIVEAAGTVFVERGYRSATIDDVAAQVGLMPGSLYYYINGKEDLLYGFAERITQKALELIEEPPDVRAADAPTRLASLIERWMQNISASKTWAAYNLIEDEINSLPMEQLAQLREQRRRFRSFIVQILEQGVSAGQFDADLRPEIAVSSISRLMWTTYQWYDEARGIPLEEVSAWYVRFVLRGVGYQPG